MSDETLTFNNIFGDHIQFIYGNDGEIEIEVGEDCGDDIKYYTMSEVECRLLYQWMIGKLG